MREATMFAFQEDGETKKDTLEADDIAGACSAYPAANDPKSCARVDVSSNTGCNCAVAATRAPSGGPWIIALLVTVLVLRRRPRRS
jgi:MYXO-CTERM domain-containing protein